MVGQNQISLETVRVGGGQETVLACTRVVVMEEVVRSGHNLYVLFDDNTLITWLIKSRSRD